MVGGEGGREQKKRRDRRGLKKQTSRIAKGHLCCSLSNEALRALIFYLQGIGFCKIVWAPILEKGFV